ncbi:MAG: hypothetical protein WC505_03130 [Patescibacteria group bacterium]
MIETKNKALILSTYAPPMMGGPMILYNLFSQFSGNSYSILTGYSAIKSQPHDNKYWLNCDYYFYDAPDKTKLDMINGDNAHKKAGVNTQKVNAQWWKRITYFITKILYFKRIDMLVNMLMQLVIIVRRGITIVKKNGIEVLIGISGDGLALIAAYVIHKITKKKYILYLFDLYRGNNFSPSIKWLARIVEPTLVRSASKIIVTNSGTKDLYNKRYGNVPIEIIYNAIFSEKYANLNNDYSPSEPYTIIFTGNIYWAQEQSIVNLIKAIGQINQIKVNLQLYLPKCPDSIKNLVENNERVSISKASPEEIPAIQNKADLLFLPLAWDTKAPEIIQTATPGKFTDYLIAGRPMLVHAPEYAYVSQYAKKFKLGLVVDHNDISILAQAITDFFMHPHGGTEYITNAKKIFFKNHDVYKNAQNLASIINKS